MNGLFGVNGLLGYLVAVVLLLSIVFVLGMTAVGIQKSEATNYYKIENPFELKMNSTSNVNHVKSAN